MNPIDLTLGEAEPSTSRHLLSCMTPKDALVLEQLLGQISDGLELAIILS